MKVLEFAFDSRDSGCANDYLPHNYTENSVAYTGTHDNETLAGWWKSITPEEQKMVREYLCDQYTPQSKLGKSLISLILRSRSVLCVIPMQDYMGWTTAAGSISRPQWERTGNGVWPSLT